MYVKYLGSTGNNKNRWEGCILLWKGGYSHPQNTPLLQKTPQPTKLKLLRAATLRIIDSNN